MRRHTQKQKRSKEPLGPLIQTFWTGNPLSRMERASLQSIANVGYNIVLYTYNPIKQFKKSVPSDPRIQVRDAREILPESKIFQYSGREAIGQRTNAFRYLPFSDLFRFTMLYKKGGSWIDLDIFMLKPIPKHILARPYAFSSERTIQKGAYKQKIPEIVDMGYIQVPGPGDPLMSWILNKIPSDMLELSSPFNYMDLFRQAIHSLDLGKYVLSANAFLPLNWWDVKDAFDSKSGVPGACYKGKYGVEPFCVDHLKRSDVFGIHWFRAIVRKKDLPYERASNRVVEDNLYDRLIQVIEDDAGLAHNAL